MPQLSPTDQAFFLLETDQRPMSIGALMVLAPPRGAGARFAERLVEGMLRRPVGPPFNFRLKPGPIRGLLDVEEDPGMDPATQVRRHKLARGSDLPALFRRICDIHVRRLPHDAPVWELHVFSGLPRGRVALYFKTHHGLIDGIGFLRILTMESIILMVFGHWYLFRYVGLGFNLGIRNTLLIAIGLSVLAVAGDWMREKFGKGRVEKGKRKRVNR